MRSSTESTGYSNVLNGQVDLKAYEGQSRFLFHRIKSHSIVLLQKHAPPGAACPDDICRVTTRSEKRRQLRHQQGGRGGQPRQLQRDIFTQAQQGQYLYNKITKTRTRLSHNPILTDRQKYLQLLDLLEPPPKDFLVPFQLCGVTQANKSKPSFLVQMVRGVNRD